MYIRVFQVYPARYGDGSSEVDAYVIEAYYLMTRYIFTGQ